MRPAVAPKQFRAISQAAQVQGLAEVRVDRVADALGIFHAWRRAVRAHQLRAPIAQQGADGRAVLKRQGIESGGMSGADFVIAAADRAQENLRAAILVEENDAGLE